MLKTDESNPGESNMLINALKDITENPSKVKSNFDQTSVDEDDNVFRRVLERQLTVKFDMEKRNNFRVEGKMNLKDERASFP